MANLLKYETTYRMRTNDFDCYDNIKLSSILNSTQDIAGIHAELLGLGYEAMLNRNYYWVIVRQGFKIYNKILPGDLIKVVTFPRKKDKLQFQRDYKIYNEDNILLCEGSSTWVVIDTIKRRISRALDIDYNGEFYLDYADINLNKLDFKLGDYKIFNYQVKRSDLDHNKHLNNSKYLDIALDTFDDITNISTNEFYIDYLHEAKFNDNIIINRAYLDNVYYFDFYVNDKLITKLIIKENEND